MRAAATKECMSRGVSMKLARVLQSARQLRLMSTAFSMDLLSTCNSASSGVGGFA